MPVIELSVAIATAAVLIVGGLRALHAGDADVVTLFLIVTSFTLYVSRFFKRLEESMPDYRERRKWLKNNGNRLLV